MNQDYTKLLGSILKNMALMDHIRPSEIPNIDLYICLLYTSDAADEI